LSLEILGLFNLAREISALVTSELRAPIRRVLYPGFARMPVEGGLLRSGYIDAFAILLLLSLPLSVGLYTLAPLLVEVVLGPRWLPAVPLLEVLALLGIVQSFGANTYLVINRIGKPMWNAAGGGVQLILFVPALVWATVRFGAIGAAWTIVAATAFMLLAEYFIMRRVLHVRICDMAAHAWRPVIGAGFMTMVMLIARRSAPAPGGALGAVLMLAVGVALGAMVYGGTVFAAWRWSGAGPGAERQIINALGQLWMPRRPFGGQF
jgi:O-antigen/teichoic acid export membrane protein